MPFLPRKKRQDKQVSRACSIVALEHQTIQQQKAIFYFSQSEYFAGFTKFSSNMKSPAGYITVQFPLK